LLTIIVTICQILTAGIAITAFSLLLYALTFNLRDRVARSFALILVCVVIVFTGEALGSTATNAWGVEVWQRFQWVGIIFLPATYLHFSVALLSTTGLPSRLVKYWAVRLIYFFSFILLLLVPSHWLLGTAILNQPPLPHLTPGPLAGYFVLYYLIIMVVSWGNLWAAYRRTATVTSRRRMTYLIVGALALSIGSFPFLVFGYDVASQQQLLFWSVAMVTNLLVGIFMVVMAYAVAFFGVPWSDRLVKSRIFKWLMRGPLTASITLALVTLVRRWGESFGIPYSAVVPIVMAVTIVVMEYVITLFAPLGSKWLFYGKDDHEIGLLRNMEDRLLTHNDLEQFFETVLAAICDRLQAEGAFLINLQDGELEMVAQTGELSFDNLDQEGLEKALGEQGEVPSFFLWQGDLFIPLYGNGEDSEPRKMLGLMGICSLKVKQMGALDDETLFSIRVLTDRVEMALRDRKMQEQVFELLESLNSEVEMIQRLRAASRYDTQGILLVEPGMDGDLTQWVKEALSHYWGGPKLTESPLMKLKIVQNAIPSHEGNPANALRSVLRSAINKNRPEGERRFTGEWILYNILEMKFLEGKKVREIATRLAMSEADLYRKQRIAIEAVTHTVMEMENQNQTITPENDYLAKG
jgi:hypothetical protein